MDTTSKSFFRSARWRSAASVHALAMAVVQIFGLTVLGWSPVVMWLMYLADDAALAAASWLRIAWAKTRAAERWDERFGAILIHMVLDALTMAAFFVCLVLSMPWPEGAMLGEAWAYNVTGEHLGEGLLVVVIVTLLDLPRHWRADRVGNLANFDEIRGNSRLLTRYLVANVALLAAMPWIGRGTGALVAAIALVVLRTLWTTWLDSRSLVGGETRG